MKIFIYAFAFLSLAAMGKPCEMRVKLLGDTEIGMAVRSELTVCGPDEAQRKINITWNGKGIEGKKIPRKRLESYLKSIRQARKELEQIPQNPDLPCSHALYVEIEDKGKIKTLQACRESEGHLIARKFYDILQDAYYTP